ncbi:hypothetical protein ACTWQB_10490 [Piscibacillus sp. B03]|uniref:hypothetical protein n=1 Tax=Piscibacillus sp. B03 TaxID=3457430 RepID=UPI003FCCFE89
MKKITYLIALTALILITIPYSLSDINAESSSYNSEDFSKHVVSSKVTGQADWTSEQAELSNEDINQVLNQFMDQLVQETDDQWKVLNYQSLEEYKSSFDQIAERKVVDYFVDEIYYEEGQTLYLKGMDTPPWFDSDQDFNKEQLDDETYRITQDNESDFYGNYRIVIDLKLNENGEPYIINVQYQ